MVSLGYDIENFHMSRYKSDFGMFCIVRVPNLSWNPYINVYGHDANFFILKIAHVQCAHSWK